MHALVPDDVTYVGAYAGELLSEYNSAVSLFN